jgi:hypothetical protein
VITKDYGDQLRFLEGVPLFVDSVPMNIPTVRSGLSAVGVARDVRRESAL